MGSTTEVILKQLENEGLQYTEMWGVHWLDMRGPKGGRSMAYEGSLTKAVDVGLSRAIRITALLSKLKESLSDDQDELGALLVSQDGEG